MNFTPRTKSPPMTAAQRQAICRAKKKGTYNPGCTEVGSIPGHLLPNTPEHEAARNALFEAKGMLPLPPPAEPAALPAPKTTELSTAKPTAKSPAKSVGKSPAKSGADWLADQVIQSLPPAVARRLQFLIDQHEAGKNLTADELAEARGLLDIAEYFVVQRMRKQLAA